MFRTEELYIEPPPVPVRVFPKKKQSIEMNSNVIQPEGAPANITDLIAVALGRTTFGGQLEGAMSEEVAAEYDSEGALMPGYYLCAPDHINVGKGKIQFRGITGESEDIDEEVLASLEDLGHKLELPPPPPRKNKPIKDAMQEANELSDLWRGKKTMNDLPRPSGFDMVLDNMKRGRHLRKKEAIEKWKVDYRNYGDPSEEYDISTPAPVAPFIPTTPDVVLFSSEMREAAKEKQIIPTHRKKQLRSDYDSLPLQSRIPEKVASKTVYSQQGGQGLSEAYWTATLRDHNSSGESIANAVPPPPASPPPAKGSSRSVGRSVSTASIAPKFHESLISNRKIVENQREIEKMQYLAWEKKQIKDRLHRKAIPKQGFETKTFQERIAQKYSNRRDVGFNVANITNQMTRQYEAKHGVTPIKTNSRRRPKPPPLPQSLYPQIDYIGDINNCNAEYRNFCEEPVQEHFDSVSVSADSTPPLFYMDGLDGFSTPRTSINLQGYSECDDESSVGSHSKLSVHADRASLQQQDFYNNQNIPVRNNVDITQSPIDEHQEYLAENAVYSFGLKRTAGRSSVTVPSRIPVDFTSPVNHDAALTERVGAHWSGRSTATYNEPDNVQYQYYHPSAPLTSSSSSQNYNSSLQQYGAWRGNSYPNEHANRSYFTGSTPFVEGVTEGDDESSVNSSASSVYMYKNNFQNRRASGMI